MRYPFPLTPSPLYFLLSPELLLSRTTTSSSLSFLGFLTCNTLLWASLQPWPMPTPSQPCRSLQGFHKSCVTCCSIPGQSMICFPLSTTVAEHSPLFGSLLRNRLQDPAPDETENSMDTGCLSWKTYPQITLKAGVLNISRQKSKTNTKMW